MGKITGLRKYIIDTYVSSSWRSRMALTATMKLGGFNARHKSTDSKEKPVSFVTQQAIDEANSDEEDTTPIMPGPDDCCDQGCQNCVWLAYVYNIKFHYEHSEDKIREALCQIPKADVREFVKFELEKKTRS